MEWAKTNTDKLILSTLLRGCTMSALVRKGFIVAISLFIGLALAPSPARAQIGVAAGYGFNIMSQPNFSSSAQNTFKSPGGISFGIFYNFPFGDRIALRPGVFIQQSSFAWHIDGLEVFSPIESTMRVASIPIDIRYRFPGARYTPYVLAGPRFNFFHTDRPELHQATDSPQGSTSFMGINIGAGVEIKLYALGLTLQPELRYSHALSGFLKEDYIVRTVPFDTDGKLSLNNLTFRVGISFLSIE